MHKRKLARVKISNDLIADFIACRVRSRIKTNAPKDLSLVSIYPDPNSHYSILWAVLESESFDEIEEGQIIPEIPSFEYEYVG